jgi:hypothetical protein
MGEELEFRIQDSKFKRTFHGMVNAECEMQKATDSKPSAFGILRSAFRDVPF